MMKSIDVPAYVADDFNSPLGNPSKKNNAVELNNARVYRLIAVALQGIEHPDWEVGDRVYHSKNDVEPYGLERVTDKFYVYSEERGRRSAIAVFKSVHLAAEYFVWLVSGGNRVIDWSLFLEMEP